MSLPQQSVPLWHVLQSCALLWIKPPRVPSARLLVPRAVLAPLAHVALRALLTLLTLLDLGTLPGSRKFECVDNVVIYNVPKCATRMFYLMCVLGCVPCVIEAVLFVAFLVSLRCLTLTEPASFMRE